MAALRWVQVRTCGRVLVLALAILAAFAAIVAPVTLALAWWRDVPWDDPATVALAIICALIAGLFFAVFHVKHESYMVLFGERAAFEATCRDVLKDLGYEVQARDLDHLVSRPSFRALLAGGRINVAFGASEARISGPKLFVEIVRKRLRLHTHVVKADRQGRDGKLRTGERLLKRVQFSMKLKPEQWEEVGEAVLATLAESGAHVLCEVHVMAQSDQGIRESTVDGALRDWFQERQIAVEIRKDHAIWEEPQPLQAAAVVRAMAQVN